MTYHGQKALGICSGLFVIRLTLTTTDFPRKDWQREEKQRAGEISGGELRKRPDFSVGRSLLYPRSDRARKFVGDFFLG